MTLLSATLAVSWVTGAKTAADTTTNTLEARLAGLELVRLLMDKGNERREAVLPAAAAQLLADMLTELARGNAVSLVPLSAELTTQQAADILGVSRPYLIGLPDQHFIKYRRVGNRRRDSAGGRGLGLSASWCNGAERAKAGA